MKPRVVRDGPFEYRVDGPGGPDPRILFRIVGGNWDYRTFHRDEPSPALTESRIRIWADLLDNPYEDEVPQQMPQQGIEATGE